MEEKVQTKHPDSKKKGWRISKEKYDLIRASIIECLKNKELTYNELSKCVGETLKGRFKGAIEWHVEVVKLDLEARKIIERINTKPQIYRLISK
jgi:hypothetical protein